MTWTPWPHPVTWTPWPDPVTWTPWPDPVTWTPWSHLYGPTALGHSTALVISSRQARLGSHFGGGGHGPQFSCCLFFEARGRSPRPYQAHAGYAHPGRPLTGGGSPWGHPSPCCAPPCHVPRHVPHHVPRHVPFGTCRSPAAPPDSFVQGTPVFACTAPHSLQPV